MEDLEDIVTRRSVSWIGYWMHLIYSSVFYVAETRAEVSPVFCWPLWKLLGVKTNFEANGRYFRPSVTDWKMPRPGEESLFGRLYLYQRKFYRICWWWCWSENDSEWLFCFSSPDLMKFWYGKFWLKPNSNTAKLQKLWSSSNAAWCSWFKPRYTGWF